MVDENPAATRMPATRVVDEQASSVWSDCKPETSIVVATHDRESFLPDLFDAMAAQESAPRYDVIVVDDGSSDATWQRLQSLVIGAEFPVLALRLGAAVGPSVARNTGVARARGRWVAFTDDDCLPERQWLAALLAASDGVDLVQGRTRPVAGGRPSVWARTIDVRYASPLYETCNLAIQRGAFLAQGGFPVLDLLPGTKGRGFGEDAALGSVIARAGGRSFAPDAVVRHRWLPGTYLDHLRGEWRLVGFPALVSLSPEVTETLWRRVFLTRRTAEVDLALAGLLLTALLRQPWPLVASAPWLCRRLRDGWRRDPRAAALRTAQLMAADVVRLAALLRGSVPARRIVM